MKIQDLKPCPGCGLKPDGIEAVTPGSVPTPGDITVCSCGNVAMFIDTDLNKRSVEGDELLDICLHNPMLARLLLAMKELREGLIT